MPYLAGSRDSVNALSEGACGQMRDAAIPAVWVRSSLRGLAMALAFALAGCQMSGEAFNEQAFQPSRDPVTIDKVARNDRMSAIARAQHPRILATYGGEYSDPKLERRIAAIVGRLAPVFKDQQSYR